MVGWDTDTDKVRETLTVFIGLKNNAEKFTANLCDIHPQPSNQVSNKIMSEHLEGKMSNNYQTTLPYWN